MRHQIRIVVAVPCIVALLTAGWPVQGAEVQNREKTASPLARTDQGFAIDFKDVELPVFIKLVGEAIQKNIVMDERVTGKVTIYAPKKLTRDELYDVFLSVIESKGFTVVPRGKVLQLMPTRDAKQSGVDVVRAGGEKRAEGLVTQIIPLEHLNAAETVKVLTPLLSKDGVIATYDPTNLLIVTDGANNTIRLEALVRELDRTPPRSTGKIHVVPLENADAEDLAKVLQGILVRSAPQAGSGQQASTAAIAAPLAGPVQITADKATNSLLISALPDDFQKVRDVIGDLDIRRRQVYVEAAIMEVSLSRIKELGIEFRSTQSPASGGLTGFGGTNFGGMSKAITGPEGFANLTGLAAGVIKGTIKFGGVEFLNIGALIRALQSQSGVNLLSTPQLLTTDNQKAEIVVGSNIPLITGRSLTTGGNPLTTVERKDIGVTLRLTPHVTEGDYVKLDIYQEISALSDPTSTTQFSLDSAGPIINKRYANTSVVVKDKETIAIGGLIREDINEVENKVPLLGDIPVLGYLFRYKKDIKEKVNLLVFLTPTIIKDEGTMREITEKKKEETNLGKGEGAGVK